MSVYIIAEAGVNHNGSLDLAFKLIEEAKRAGADAVKFQTFTASTLVTKHASKAEYQLQLTGDRESQFEMIRKLELSHNDHEKIKKKCFEVGINFLSTPFDIPSIDYLFSLGVPFFKIPSGEITNLPYLREIARYSLDVILSTGMSTLDEVRGALDVLTSKGLKKKQITLLHCNTEYPTPMGDVNLRAMITMSKELGVKVGYSDHTLGIEVPIAAVALGATVIEKHFTLDRNMEGPDHKASLMPDELHEMVRLIRNIESALGDGVKRVTESETKNMVIARKSIVAKTSIKKGEPLTDVNLTTKRPGSGISPMEWDRVVGTKAIRDFVADELIEL